MPVTFTPTAFARSHINLNRTLDDLDPEFSREVRDEVDRDRALAMVCERLDLRQSTLDSLGWNEKIHYLNSHALAQIRRKEAERERNSQIAEQRRKAEASARYQKWLEWNSSPEREAYYKNQDKRRNDPLRNRKIWLLRAEGYTFDQIGEWYSLTRERIRQICHTMDRKEAARGRVARQRWKRPRTRPIDMGGPRGVWIVCTPENPEGYLHEGER